jgi:hypothetical protein
MGSGWIGMSGGNIGGGCEIGRLLPRIHALPLPTPPFGSLPAEGPGSEGVRTEAAPIIAEAGR